MPFAESDSCRVYYRLEGSRTRPLLVLVHALGTDHGMWDPQMPALLRHFQVLRLDLPGHGASTSPPGDYSMSFLGAAVLAAVDATGRDRFACCGLSLGGMVAQWLGAHAGGRLDALVLANTSPRVEEPAIFDAVRTAVLREGMGVVESVTMELFFSSSAAHPAADSIRTVLLATDPVGYAGCCAAIRDLDHRPLLGGLAVPALVIGGDRDISTPWEGHGSVLAAGIPGARSRMLAAGHLSNLERPSGFTAALLEFLLPAAPPDTLAAGFAMRRSVLGNAHVDRAIANTTGLTRDFQELIARYAWGSVWTRPGLDTRTRRLLVLAITASLGRWEEFRLHVTTGLAAELEAEDLEEVLLQVAVYAGVPAANTGFQIASEKRPT